MQNKLLGQHWLYDEAVLESVVDAAGVVSADVVLEVGPGLGTLTAKLLNRGSKVIAIEKDEHLATRLEAKNIDNLQVIEGDILQFDFNSLPAGYKVAANIPYYLTSALVRLLLESDNQPAQIGILIQKEVAERIVAGPGKMSVLSFAVQYYADVDLDIIVPAELFDPPPKVDSQIISIRPYPEPVFEADQKLLFRLVKAGFSEKRKKLRNALAGGLSLEKDKIGDIMDSANIEQTIRAQELSIDQWKALYIAYKSAV
ncbi:ribosomal RNA small subunit methyltransferase A [Candidatus Saccharibacteria bacterium]|jgi:16S rRNA (adenine1518-N6/adenine1519-N6)-dimethyltransferase|nr:ribosomal RNA small subunit methyltransferase A [Candidatus Saccharibacteria bacterium]